MPDPRALPGRKLAAPRALLARLRWGDRRDDQGAGLGGGCSPPRLPNGWPGSPAPRDPRRSPATSASAPAPTRRWKDAHVAALRAARADPCRVLGRLRRRRLARRRPRGGAGDAAELPRTGTQVHRRLRAGMERLLDGADAAGIPVGIVSNALSGQVHLDWLAEHGMSVLIRPSGSQRAYHFAQFELTQTYPPHATDQLSMYEDLVYNTPGLTAAQIPNFFKDASFGVQAGRTSSAPTARAPGCTVQRDQLRRRTRLRRDPLRHDLLRRLRRRRGPPLLHGRPAARRTCPALRLRRRLEQGDGRRRLGELARTTRPTSRSRSTRPTTSTAAEGAAAAAGPRRLRRRHQPVHLGGPHRPEQDALRVRRDRQDARRLAEHRRDRDRRADRRHLRQGRRQRARQRARADRREGALRRRGRRAGLARLPPHGRPRGADHGRRQQRLLRLSRASAAAPASRCPTQGSLVDPPNNGAEPARHRRSAACSAASAR